MTAQPANAIAARPKPPMSIGASGVELRSLDEAWRFATIVAKSGLAPRGMDAPEKIFISIQHGLEVGLKPWQAIQSIAVVNGRPTMWGDAVIALVISSGLLDWQKDWEEGTGANLVVYYSCKRAGQPEAITRSFGWADAMKAGLATKDTYKNYPRRMCFNRARAFALRDLFPDVLRGINIREEVEEYPESAGERRSGVPRPRPRLSDLASADSVSVEDEEPLPAGEVIDVERVDGSASDAASGARTPLPPDEATEEPPVMGEEWHEVDEAAGEESQEFDMYAELLGRCNDTSVMAPAVRRAIDAAKADGLIDQQQADQLEIVLVERINRIKAAAPKTPPSNHAAAAVAKGKAKAAAKKRTTLLDDEPGDGSEAYRQG